MENLPIPTTEDLKYLAGYFDGEGCITVFPQKKRNCHVLRITVCSGDKMCVDLYSEFFGGSVLKRRAEWNSNRQMWYWSLTGQAAQDFLVVIGPHLKSAKSDQAFMACLMPIMTNGKRLHPIEKGLRSQLGAWIRQINQRVTLEPAHVA